MQPPPFQFLKTSCKGADPTPPINHPRQLDGYPRGTRPFSSFVPTCMLMNRYYTPVIVMNQSRTILYI